MGRYMYQHWYLTSDALLMYGITSHTPDTFTIDGMLELMCSMSREEERI